MWWQSGWLNWRYWRGTEVFTSVCTWVWAHACLSVCRIFNLCQQKTTEKMLAELPVFLLPAVFSSNRPVLLWVHGKGMGGAVVLRQAGRQTDRQGWWAAGCPSKPIMFNEMRSDQSPWKMPDDTNSLSVASIHPECCDEKHHLLGEDLQHITGNTDNICSVDYCGNHGMT